MKLDLALVMPVYNEEACIVRVVESWSDALARFGMSFRIIVLNDGSRDATAKALEVFAGDDRIEIVHKKNSGHGPTILVGYARATEIAQWIFQTDSDGEMSPECFGDLWKRRDEYDALLGIRSGRVQNVGRRLISTVSRLVVGMLFGSGVRDVNVPYRLIRSEILKKIVSQIPPDTFAPNVIVSGAIARAKVRIFNHPVPHENRQTGSVSIVRWKLWKSAARAFWQTLRCHPRL